MDKGSTHSEWGGEESERDVNWNLRERFEWPNSRISRTVNSFITAPFLLGIRIDVKNEMSNSEFN